ncbi:MAG: glycosyltransferase [Gammaproteobacteria bacterium]|nr:glycosyltransferase [Gammaproteobacteria bacterium]MDH5591382.1 glycosyltransferase [Gammaproteobacteria bacterium]
MNQSPSKKPSYSIVLVNYKTHQVTSICLNLLHKAFKGSDVQVWVVDNNSNDASTDYLRSLDWIHFIERTPEDGEPGFMGHGLALDLVLDRISTDYLFLLHTDTFVHNPVIFETMMKQCLENENIAAVGCVDQLYRGRLRIAWRFITRFFKHYSRRIKLSLGLKSKQPKPFYEVYLKSFCALWNVKIMKEHALTFAMNNRTPGYEAQDQLMALGYKISYISARNIFKYLDHVEAATVSAQDGYHENHRRIKKYHAFLEKYSKLQ